MIVFPRRVHRPGSHLRNRPSNKPSSTLANPRQETAKASGGSGVGTVKWMHFCKSKEKTAPQEPHCGGWLGAGLASLKQCKRLCLPLQGLHRRPPSCSSSQTCRTSAPGTASPRDFSRRRRLLHSLSRRPGSETQPRPPSFLCSTLGSCPGAPPRFEYKWRDEGCGGRTGRGKPGRILDIARLDR